MPLKETLSFSRIQVILFYNFTVGFTSRNLRLFKKRGGKKNEIAQNQPKIYSIYITQLI